MDPGSTTLLKKKQNMVLNGVYAKGEIGSRVTIPDHLPYKIQLKKGFNSVNCDVLKFENYVPLYRRQ
jgi:hypothetical protein